MDIVTYLLKDQSNAHEMYRESNLDWVVKSLRHNSKNDILHFITNHDKSMFIGINDNIRVYGYDDFISNDMLEFDANYVHLSTNYHDFEKNSILGYLMTSEFCSRMKITRFAHLEPDVLSFSENLQNDLTYFTKHGYGLTLLNRLGAGGSFFDLELFDSLKMFNAGVLASYSADKNRIPKMFDMEKEKIYYKESVDKRLRRGGVSDMHFWNYIYHTNKDKVFGNMEMPIDNVIHHCCYENQHDMDLKCDANRILQLSIIDGKCFGTNSTGAQIQIKLLHFPGHHKKSIERFVK